VTGSEKRKSERLEGRFEVIVREKLATWATRTLDVGPRGCRIELKRPLTPGMLVQVIFSMGPGVEPLVAHGQVVWARRSPPLTAGIAFLSVPRQGEEAPGKPGAWIDRLLGVYVRRIALGTPPAAGKRGPPFEERVASCPVIVPPAP
jgi:hypothetical protein